MCLVAQARSLVLELAFAFGSGPEGYNSWLEQVFLRSSKFSFAQASEVGMTGGGCEEKIFVSVRLRPLNEKEIARNDVCDWECINEDTVIFKNCNLPLPVRSMYSTAYTFVMCGTEYLGVTAPQKKVYEKEAKDVALSVVSGINCEYYFSLLLHFS
ncbi:hypothetical protein HYC85_004045 [Camellia sinensis]|uniref:Kinesin motor domain-containing protein n=1 Tax=Camellia sinensis TaxID=4442 RepID=A0A7J7HVD0_CAMSI|nr:hypothetical protein HYC85_004045 [Camellia sinensis]